MKVGSGKTPKAQVRFELSAPEAVQRVRDTASAFAEWFGGIPEDVEGFLKEKGMETGVHEADLQAVLDQVKAASPSDAATARRRAAGPGDAQAQIEALRGELAELRAANETAQALLASLHAEVAFVVPRAERANRAIDNYRRSKASGQITSISVDTAGLKPYAVGGQFVATTVLKVHVGFSVVGMLDVEGSIACYFSRSNGTALKGTSPEHRTSDGQAVVTRKFLPNYESCQWADFDLEIPLPELNCGSGRSDLIVLVIVRTGDSSELQLTRELARRQGAFGLSV